MTNRLRVHLLLLASALLPAAGLSAQIDQQQLFEQQRRGRQDQYRSIDMTTRSLPKLPGVVRLDELFQLRVRPDRGIECASPPFESSALRARQYRVELEGFAGVANVLVSMNSTPPPRGERDAADTSRVRTFSLTLAQLGPTADSLSVTRVQANPGTFQIERNVQKNGGYEMIRLEQTDRLPSGRGLVQFWVIRHGNDIPEPISVNIQEADFATLLRNHPRDVQEQLRPLLSELGQEHLFAPDANIAWQVLADHWPIEETTRPRVASLLPALNDEDFRKREAGVSALVRLGRPGAAVLRSLDRGSLSAEQNRLVDLALAPFQQLSPRDATRLAVDKSFLLDCLYVEDAAIRRAAFAQLRNLTGDQRLSFDADDAPAKRFQDIRAMRPRLDAPPATQPALPRY